MITEQLWAIAGTPVLAMYSLKTVEWGVFVGSHPTNTLHFILWVGEMHVYTIALRSNREADGYQES